MLALIAAALMTVSHIACVSQAHLQTNEVARVERSETREMPPPISLRSIRATVITVTPKLAQYCVPEHTDADRIFCHD
jgi:hypothetical protein